MFLKFKIFLIRFLYFYYWKMFFASEANWGSSAQAAVFVNALKGIQNLTDTQEHVKNYRPKVNATNVFRNCKYSNAKRRFI